MAGMFCEMLTLERHDVLELFERHPSEAANLYRQIESEVTQQPKAKQCPFFSFFLDASHGFLRSLLHVTGGAQRLSPQPSDQDH
eukprot:1383256-Prymnesium_polylepis.3